MRLFERRLGKLHLHAFDVAELAGELGRVVAGLDGLGLGEFLLALRFARIQKVVEVLAVVALLHELRALRILVETVRGCGVGVQSWHGFAWRGLADRSWSRGRGSVVDGFLEFLGARAGGLFAAAEISEIALAE